MKSRNLLTGAALQTRAEELGVVTSGDGLVTIPGKDDVLLLPGEYELQRRVLEAERHLREHRLWMVAPVSAIASVISALAARLAILRK